MNSLLSSPDIFNRTYINDFKRPLVYTSDKVGNCRFKERGLKLELCMVLARLDA